MRKLLLVALLLVASGCSSVPADVVESIGILRDNTHSLSKHYGELIDRAPAPEPPAAPEGETEEQKEKRLAAAAKAWKNYKKHKRMLMTVNNTLANKVYTWAEVSQEDPAEESSDD
jgi:hypothetical protein